MSLQAPPAIKTFWREAFLVGLLCVLIYKYELHKRDLWTPGEARVAQVARQMRASGDYIVPYLGSELRLAKPPLAYWLVVAASAFDSDVNEYNSRLPSAVAGMFSAILLCLWARSAFGGYAGLTAGVAFATTSACWWQARNSTIEMTLLFFTVAALFAWWQYHCSGVEAKPSKPFFLYLCYAALGFATLDKGPVIPPLVLLLIVVYLLCSGENPLRLKLSSHLLGLIIFFLITLPWVVAVTMKVGKLPDGSYQTFHEWFFQSVGRFKGFDHIKEFWYFVPKILGDGQPWILFALLGMAASFRRDFIASCPPLRFFVVWVVVTFIFFSIPASKKSYYILPIYPGFALLASWFLENLRRGIFRERWPEKLAVALCCFAGVLLLAVGVSLPFVIDILLERLPAMAKYSNHTPQLMLTAFAALLFGLFLLRQAQIRKWGELTAGLATAVIFAFAIHTSLLPALNAHKGDKVFCQALEDKLTGQDVVYTYDIGGQPVYRFYLNRQVTRIISPFYLLQAIKNTAPDKRFLLGIQERDWLKFDGIFLLRWRNPKLELQQVKELATGFKFRYPQAVEEMSSLQMADGTYYFLLKIAPRLPSRRAGEDEWLEWRKRKKAMSAELSAFRSRLQVLGVRSERLTRTFSEIAPAIGTGRLWLEYIRPEKTFKKLRKLPGKNQIIPGRPGIRNSLL